jgi:hypothetical protein
MKVEGECRTDFSFCSLKSESEIRDIHIGMGRRSFSFKIPDLSSLHVLLFPLFALLLADLCLHHSRVPRSHYYHYLLSKLMKQIESEQREE